MRKNEIVQAVMDAAGMDFGHRTAAIHISTVFNSVVGQLFARDNNQFQFFCKRVKISGSNRTFIIPMSLIQTYANSKGVVRGMTTGAECPCLPDDSEFYPMPPYALKSSVDANNMADFIFYTVTVSVIRFNNSLPKEVTELLFDVVPEFQEYLDEDIISLPMGVAQAIIDGAVSSLRSDPAHTNIYKPK